MNKTPALTCVLANVYAQTGQFEKAAAAQMKGHYLSILPTLSVNAFAGNTLYYAGKFKEAIPFLEEGDPYRPQTSKLVPAGYWACPISGQPSMRKAIAVLR